MNLFLVPLIFSQMKKRESIENGERRKRVQRTLLARKEKKYATCFLHRSFNFYATRAFSRLFDAIVWRMLKLITPLGSSAVKN